MKKIFLLLFLLLVPASVFAQEGDAKNNDYCISQQTEDVETLLFSQRGCCSHHGGVAGCSGGRVVCGDGSFSPSCTCLKDENPKQNS